jgi:hypothetical protein
MVDLRQIKALIGGLVNSKSEDFMRYCNAALKSEEIQYLKSEISRVHRNIQFLERNPHDFNGTNTQ